MSPSMPPTDDDGGNSGGNSNSNSNSGLSSGGKAAIGVVFGLLGFAGIAYGFYYYNKTRKDASLLASAINNSNNR